MALGNHTLKELIDILDGLYTCLASGSPEPETLREEATTTARGIISGLDTLENPPPPAAIVMALNLALAAKLIRASEQAKVCRHVDFLYEIPRPKHDAHCTC